jgi:transposase
VLHELTAAEADLLILLFPHLAGLDLDHVEDLDDGVRIVASTRTAALACRGCGVVSARAHDRYRRRLQDLACGGRPVQVVLEVRRFICGNPACPVATFAEQVPGLTGWYQRRTAGLRALLETVALALAGRAGSRLAGALGVMVSRVTLIRLVRALPDPQAGQVAVLGVDDVARRKGHSYATVLVDMGSHRVIDMLPDREADTFAAWLRAHPGVEVICRDRGGAYADGARQGAPDAIQVADRWHLWHNLGGHVEKAVARHRDCLNEPAPEQARPAGDQPTPDLLQAAADAAALRAQDSTLARRTRERYEQVQGLRAQGLGIKPIMRELGLAKETVRRFYRACSVDELLVKTRGGRPSLLDEFKPYLHQRWNEGCTNVRQLHAEIASQGFRGGYGTVRDYLQPFRELGVAPPAVPAPPKTRHLASWILRDPDSLSDDEKAKLSQAKDRCPHLRALAGHVTEFAKILTGLHGDRLDGWITAIEADDQPDLHSFTRGLKHDHDAVVNGLTLPYSSGAVEGTNCKIKHLKRLMYGRANFDLLRKMALLN